MPLNKHYGHSWYLSDSSFQILIIGGHYITPIGLNLINETIIRIGPLMLTREPLKPRILRQLECKSVSVSHLLELSDYAVRDAWDALGQKTVHHAREHVELVLDTKVYEIGIDYDVIWWA